MNWKKLIDLKFFYNKNLIDKYKNKNNNYGIIEIQKIIKIKMNIKTKSYQNNRNSIKTKKQKTIKYYNQCFDKGRLKNFVLWFLLTYGENRTVQLVEKLKNIGFEYASKAGISLGIEDLRIPSRKIELIYEAEKQTFTTENQYLRAEITGVERFQRLINTWHKTSEILKQEVIENFERTDLLNPVYMMAFSGARGNISQVRQLVGMRGLMANPQGQIIDFPIRSNFREGLTLTEYIISSYGARKGIVDTALRTANAGYLTRRLVDVAQQVMISNFDCGTHRGIFLMDMKEGKKTIHSLTQRIVGRILARDISIASRNDEITIDLAFEIGKKFEKVFVRSPLTCETSKLICQLCYGWSLAQGHLVSIGEAVGVVAAQSIGEPGTQLTMRTFHTGGVFSGDLNDQIRAPYDGIVEYMSAIPGNIIRTLEGQIAFLTKNEGSFRVKSIHSNKTTEISYLKKYKIPSYTILFIRNGQKVIEKDVIAQISSFSKNTSNITDNAEFTIQSKLEGQFYSKTLRFREKFIGPNQFNKNAIAIKSIKNNSENVTQFTPLLNHHNFIPNNIVATFYKIPVYTKSINESKISKKMKTKSKQINHYKNLLRVLLKNKKFHSTQNNSDSLKIITPLLSTYNKIEKLYEAWTWGFAWILSGKIYELNFITPFFAKIGDYLNLKSCLNQTLWKIKTGLTGHLIEYPLQLKIHYEKVANKEFLKVKNYTNPFIKKSNITRSTRNTTPPFILLPLLSLNIEKITFKKIGYFLKLSNFYYPLCHVSSKRSLKLMYVCAKYIHKTSLKSNFLQTVPVFIDHGNFYFNKKNIKTKNKVKLIGKRIFNDFYNKIFLNLEFYNNEIKDLDKNLLRCNYNTYIHTYMSLSDIQIFNKNIKFTKWKAYYKKNFCKNFFYKNIIEKKINPSDILFSSKSMHNAFNKSGYLSFIKKQQKNFNKKKNFATKLLWFPSKTQTLTGGFAFFDDIYLNKNPLTGNTQLYIKTKKNQNSYNSFIPRRSDAIAMNLYKKRNAIASKHKNSDSVINNNLINFKINHSDRDYTTKKLKNFNFYYKPLVKNKQSLCTLMTSNKLFKKNLKNFYNTNKITFSKTKFIKKNIKKNFLKKFKFTELTFSKKNPLCFLEKKYINIVDKEAMNRIKDKNFSFFFTFKNGSFTNNKNLLDKNKKFLKNHLFSSKKKNGKKFEKIYFLTQQFLLINKDLLFGMKWKNSYQLYKKFFDSKKNNTKFTTIYWISNEFKIPKYSTVIPLEKNKTFIIQKKGNKKSLNSLIIERNRQSVYKTLNYNKFFEKKKKKNNNIIFISPLYSKKFLIKDDLYAISFKQKSRKQCLKNFCKTILSYKNKKILKYKIKNININYTNIPMMYLSKYIWKEANKIYGLKNIEKLCFFMTHILKNFKIQYKKFIRENFNLKHKFINFIYPRKINKYLPLKQIYSKNSDRVIYCYYNLNIKMISSNNEKIIWKVFSLKNQKINTFLENINNKICTQYNQIFYKYVSNRYILKKQNIQKNSWVYLFTDKTKQQVNFFINLHKKIITPGQFFLEHLCFDSPVSLFIEFNLIKMTNFLSYKSLKNLKWIKNKKTRFFFNKITVSKKNQNIALFFKPVEEYNLLKDINLQNLIYEQMIFNNKNLFKCLPLQEKWIKYKNIAIALPYKNIRKHSDRVLLMLPYNFYFYQQMLKKFFTKIKNKNYTFLCQKFYLNIKDGKLLTSLFYKYTLSKKIYINKSYDSLFLLQQNKMKFYNKQEKTIQPLLKNPTCNLYVLSNIFTNTLIYKTKTIKKKNYKKNIAKEIIKNKGNRLNPKKFVISLKPINFSTFLIYYKTPYLLDFFKHKTYSYTYKPILNFEKQKNPQFSTNLVTILDYYIKYTKRSRNFKDFSLKKEKKNLTECKYLLFNTLISKIYQSPFFNYFYVYHINKIHLFDNKKYLTKYLYSLNNVIYIGYTLFKTSNLSPFIGEIVYMKPLQKSMLYVSEGSQILNKNKNNYSKNCMFLTKKDVISFYISSGNFKNVFMQFVLNKNKKYIIDNIFVKKFLTNNNNKINSLFSNGDHKQNQMYENFNSISKNSKYKNFNLKISQLDAGTPRLIFKSLLGEFFVNGSQLGHNTAITLTGQIIHYNNQKITLRHSQPIFISPKGILHKFDGDFIDPKTPVITLSYQRLKTGDIIQGIPKVEQFFEARTTKRGRLFRDSIPTLLKAIFKRYKSKFPLKQAVRQSFYKIQQILVDGVQRVYKSQGVTIADKHLEVIVKQMTSKVCIIEGAQTGFFPGEIVEFFLVEKINKFLIQKIKYEPIVLGITRASLEVDSFISAASFQQTSKVLSKAAIYKKKDFLKGLKENVILGNLIPTGTGFFTDSLNL